MRRYQPDRNPPQCISRFNYLLRPGILADVPVKDKFLVRLLPQLLDFENGPNKKIGYPPAKRSG
jgi:hypothetical protein